MRPDTLERIAKAIEELSYKPNQAARLLKTGYVPVLGLIIPSVANPFYGMLARYIEDTALELGFKVFLGNSDRKPEMERSYAEELWSFGVRGIIFGSALTTLAHLNPLIEQGLHVLVFDRPGESLHNVPVDSVSVDNKNAARLATRHLIDLGHRRIGFLSGAIRTVSRKDRLEGYRAALREAGIQPDPALVCETQPSAGKSGDAEAFELGRAGAHQLLKLSPPPSAVFAINDMYAFGAYAAARDLGLAVPDDLSVIGFDDIVLAEIVQPPLTTIQQPIREIARAAVQRIIGRVQGTVTGTVDHQSLPARLIVRDSTAQPNSLTSKSQEN
jgi:DNA-binding LacI/PurR family transcriptional regulator